MNEDKVGIFIRIIGTGINSSVAEALTTTSKKGSSWALNNLSNPLLGKTEKRWIVISKYPINGPLPNGVQLDK